MKTRNVVPAGVTVETCGCCEFDHRSDQFADCRADWYGLLPADLHDDPEDLILWDADGDPWISRADWIASR